MNNERGAVDVGTAAEIVPPLQPRRGHTELALFSTVTTFGTAPNVTLAELAVEAFYPADSETAAELTAGSSGARGPSGQA